MNVDNIISDIDRGEPVSNRAIIDALRSQQRRLEIAERSLQLLRMNIDNVLFNIQEGNSSES